jgi:hypothetical protein
MFKNIFNDLKLNRISYLLEIIEKQNFKQKVDAYNKLRKIKINEESGHLIIDKVMSLKHKDIDNFNADISLLSLLFTNYYDSYSEHLYEVFNKLTDDSKTEFLNILANSNEPSVIILYRTLIYTNYKKLDNYPIGTLNKNKYNYELLFPELYDTFKTKNTRNNLLLLLSDYINLGIVPLYHLNKNKKVLQRIIIDIFKEGIKFKLNTRENFMANKEYIDLRVFLEVAINIEYYVSNKDTKTYLDKLFKTKDNQLKLFVLENYVRKGMSLSKINLNSIAKDNLSRAPLYSFLSYNNASNLMPKKYKNNKDISLSDLYINYSIYSNYSKVPYDFELLEERIVGDYKYFIYKFKTPFDYNEEIIDPVTDYLLKNIKVTDALNNNGETTYIGISGGYNKNDDPSLIESPLDGIKIAKFTEDYKKIVDKLLEEKNEKQKEDHKQEVSEEKEEKKNVFFRIFNFSKILSFFSIITILLFTVLLLYISNIDIFNLRKTALRQTNIVEAVLLKPKDLFGEINYRDIFNEDESEYYVLFFKKKDKSTYYEYLNTLLKNEYKFYYVDLSNKDNKPIYEGNETGFVITEDTLLKVKNHDYSFYVIGKKNIIKEFKGYVEEIIEKEEAEKKAKEKELKKKEATKKKDTNKD